MCETIGRILIMSRSRYWLVVLSALSLLTFSVQPASATARSTGWVARPPLNQGRIGATVATVDGKIVVFGGFTFAGETLGSTEARRVAGSGVWRTLAPMPTPRANAAAAALGDAVYVIGGYPVEGTSDLVERYDVKTNTWSTATKLPRPRGASAAATLNDRIYVAGGYYPLAQDEEIATNSVIAFDPRKRAWQPMAPMPTARGFLRLVAAGNHLYAIGGLAADGNSLTTVERYDPRTDRWTMLAPMNVARRVPGVVAVQHGSDTLIAAVGGCQTVDGQLVGFDTTTEVYSVRTGTWRTLSALLPGGRCSLNAAAEADGTVLAIGGITNFDNRSETAEVLAIRP
jgi:N-acetylneuraminic acid mutarotase